MASDLKPFINGSTGRVTDLAPHQGKLYMKDSDVCFTRDVVTMPGSVQPPKSLLECLKVGDCLHFNGKLTTDPVTKQHIYLATKVWFPNTKNMSGKETPSRQSPVPPAKNTAKKLRKCIMQILQEEGSLTVEQLFLTLQKSHATLLQVCTNTPEGLRFFVNFQKMYFVLTNDRVSLVMGGKSLVQKCVRDIMKWLLSSGSVTLHRLYQLLQSSDEDVRHFIFSVKALHSFLETHPEDFVVLPDGTVYPAVETSEKPTKAAQVPKETCDEELTTKCVAYIKKVLEEKGPLTIAQLTAQVVGAPWDIGRHIGGTHDEVAAFLKTSKAFDITESGTILYGSKKKKNKGVQSGMQNALPRHHCGPIVTVTPKFGFIRHGTAEEENIFFNPQSFWNVDQVVLTDLTTVLVKGELVDCLFIYKSLGKGERNKCRAVATWKKLGDDDSDHGDVAAKTASFELLALPTVLTCPVLYGHAKVKYLAGDIGYCCLSADSDSLIKFEDGSKVQDALVAFHVGHMSGRNELRPHLKKGTNIMFVATQCKSKKCAQLAIWNAINIWPLPKASDEAPPGPLSSVTAEVKELTSEGGRLSFANDPWAHSITFSWGQIMSNTKGQLGKANFVEVGDTFWCIVASGQIMKDSSKWVAVELFPCNLGMASSAPSRYLACPPVPLPNMFPFDNDNHANRDPPGVARSRSSSSESESMGILEPKKNTVESQVDLLLDMGSSSEESDAPRCARNAAAPKSDVPEVLDRSGKMVSKDNYGGIVETDGGDVVKFTAHAFFYAGRPVSHLAFPVGTQVHFDGKYTANGEIYAPTVWIGKRPRTGQDANFP